MQEGETSDAISKAIEAMDMARSAVGPFSVIVTRKLTESINALQALQHSGEPIAYVRGWFLGECVIHPLDRSLAIPVGMALYAAPQPVVPEGYVLVPIHAFGEWVTDGKGGE